MVIYERHSSIMGSMGMGVGVGVCIDAAAAVLVAEVVVGKIPANN